MTAPSLRREVAEANLLAARRAKAAVAFESALIYLAAGFAILDREARAWSEAPALAFALELERADCEYLTAATATPRPGCWRWRRAPPPASIAAPSPACAPPST